ncbi:hypothetical protein [Photobacterium phosphoreum]|uniref:hypothetical protein n=1 Tax=Photobacterium phosphoreum TaxID=659 RepID=UPI0039AE9FEC
MSFLEFIHGNQGAVIAATAALGGVLITAIFNVLQKYLDNKHTKSIKRLEIVIDFEKCHLIEPILTFLDADLIAMRDVYNIIFINKVDRENISIKNEHLQSLPSVKARIRGLGDKELSQKFDVFTRKRLLIGNAIETVGSDPYKELESGIELAGEIICLLLKRVRMLEN